MKYLGRGGKRWRRVDQTLAEGLLLYEASLNEVGIPSWLARDSDRRFVVDEVVDHAMATLEEAQEEMSRGDGKQPGLRLTVADGGVDD